ncbi:MAG: FlgO family outer membrane protein, partial [Bacteroidota bacterium]
TDRNISEIAYLTGNKSPQNFSKYFIEAYGISPSAYRKKLKTKRKKSIGGNALKTKLKPNLILQSIAVLCLCFAFGFFIKQYFFNGGRQVKALEINSIAVIPFENQSRAGNDFLGEGIAEDILAKLAQFGNLKVLSKTATNQFRGDEKDIQQIGNSLRVNYILSGNIRTNQDKIIINTELIRVKDQHLIWSERYVQPKNKLISMQAEVAQSIASALNQNLQPDIQQKLERIPTNNNEAYTALLRGRHLMRSRTSEDLLKSKDQFLLALDLDPQFSEAYEGIARVYHLLVNLRYAKDQAQEYSELAEKNVLNAIKYNRNNGKAYAILGNLYADQYRWEEAISSFEIALELNPKDPIINYWFSLRLRSVGDLERALSYHQKASELDPLHPVIQAGYIYTCGLAGAFDLADSLLRKVEPIMINSFLFYVAKGNLLMRKGAFQEAIPFCQKALELNPDFKTSESNQFYCLGKLGKRQAVLDYIDLLDKTQGIDCLRAAVAFMGIEEEETALDYLEKAASLGVIDDDLIAEPIFARLRTYPTYQNILEQYQLSPFVETMEMELN